jgi:hypothetical protein
MLKEEAFLNNPILNILAVFFFYSIVPFASVYYLRLRGRSDVFMSERSRRPKHFIPGLLGYMVSILVFQACGMRLMRTASASFLLTSLILLILTFVTKVSIHVAGLTATVVLILHAYWPAGSILLLLIPVLAWARVNTGEHTYRQTMLGAFTGLTGSVLGILFFPTVS